jgi:hypothetical protein
MDPSGPPKGIYSPFEEARRRRAQPLPRFLQDAVRAPRRLRVRDEAAVPRYPLLPSGSASMDRGPFLFK